jgi:hypothetical protein
MKIETIGTGGNCQALIANTNKCQFLITHAEGPDLPEENQEYRISIYKRNRAMSDDEPTKTFYFKKYKADKLEEKLKQIVAKL